MWVTSKLSNFIDFQKKIFPLENKMFLISDVYNVFSAKYELQISVRTKYFP